MDLLLLLILIVLLAGFGFLLPVIGWIVAIIGGSMLLAYLDMSIGLDVILKGLGTIVLLIPGFFAVVIGVNNNSPLHVAIATFVSAVLVMWIWL